MEINAYGTAGPGIGAMLQQWLEGQWYIALGVLVAIGLVWGLVNMARGIHASDRFPDRKENQEENERDHGTEKKTTQNDF